MIKKWLIKKMSQTKDRIYLFDKSHKIRELINAIQEETGLSRESIAIYSLRKSAGELKTDHKHLIKKAKKYEDYLNFKYSIKTGTMEAHQIYYVSNIKKKIVNMVINGVNPQNILNHIITIHKIAQTMDEDIYNNEKETWKYILKINKNTLIKIATFIKQYKKDNVNSKEVKMLVAYDIDNFIKKQEAKEKGIMGDIPDQIIKSKEQLKEIGEYISYADDDQFKTIIKHLKLIKKNNLEKNKQIIEVKNDKNNQE